MDGGAVPVTLAEIARIAGVGRAAVSNWRRRFDDFPSPTGGTDTSPQFSLADAEEWLVRHGKFQASAAGERGRLWPRFEALGDRDAMGRVIAAVGARAAGRPAPELAPGERALLGEAEALGAREGSPELFAFLLERWLAAHVRQVATTPAPLADLMAALVGPGPVRSVLDPACGSGTLLLAAGRRWPAARLAGREIDPVPAELAAARLALAGYAADVRAGDSLRSGVTVQADAVLCSLPANERDWGYAELVTDPRWTFGLPPRTESELAWVQHAHASLAPGGTAVLVLPPAAASRRAGRRIRAGLLRAGALRAVIALPPGAAPPHGVGLHLWVLGKDGPAEHVRLVDAAGCRTSASGGRSAVDWDGLREQALAGGVEVPVIDLLDEHVDLSPARCAPTVDFTGMAAQWQRVDALLAEAARVRRRLADLDLTGRAAASVPLADLERAGLVGLEPGRTPGGTGGAPAGGDALRVLAAAGRGEDGPAATAPRGEGTIAAAGDVVVATAMRAFDVWVLEGEDVLLGPQLLAIRFDPDRFDAWFLAGCLRSPANMRRAGGHASSSSRIDVRRMQVPRLPLEQQRRYGEAFRDLREFEAALRGLRSTGRSLRDSLSDVLAEGLLRVR
ncbi:N-6 DNA methylase [Actinomadura parmotrematis]|uniref:N-6 DNA methylase n=1 Tax=Actinomadura parmotrematis TaxID=2864039 RepID=A0ABS7FYP9_9ACTN|nr:N-6 DNA methylase [Actinomadura parmotrematis]MBW8485568.1 N-6 DNA methylase [Actinomadura parmotrematis]